MTTYNTKTFLERFYIKGDDVFIKYFQVSMWSESKYGKSLPTYEVKVVTHLQGESSPSTPSEKDRATLPDIRGCCLGKNVSHSG